MREGPIKQAQYDVPIWRRITAIILFVCFIPLWVGLGGPPLGLSSFGIGWMLGIFFAGKPWNEHR